MNSRKVRYSWFVVCLSVFLGFSWTAPAAAGDAGDLRLAAGPQWGGGVGSTKPAPSLPAKPLPAGSPLAAPKTSQPTQATAQPVEPTWPQPFELGPGEQTGFGFVAGTPGLIVVNVRWTGVPLTVILAKPGGVFIYQQGNGSVTLQYNATADDVKKGVLWGVSLRPAQVAAKPPAGSGITVIEKPVKIDTRGVAKGTINVQHPPGDMNLARAELNARAAAKAQTLQPKSRPAATAAVNIVAQKQAALQKQQAIRQAALLEQIRSRIPALVSSAGSNAGSNPPATIVADPVIISLGSTSGQPGDAFLILGSGFSSVPGEVHFIVANGKDVFGQTNFWNDEAIIAIVPDVSGIQAFNGQVYVKRGASKSNSLAFRFEPSVEYKTLVLKQQFIKQAVGIFIEGTDPPDLGVVRHDYTFILEQDWPMLFAPPPFYYAGGGGDDEFSPGACYEDRVPPPPFPIPHSPFPTPIFPCPYLKNGWTGDSAYLSLPGPWGGKILIGGEGSADAYISEFTPGTDAPYLKVHWWADFLSGVWYSPYIVIKGPKGLPYK